MVASVKKESINTRLKNLRTSFRFSRKYFFNKYGLPEITLQKWETAERSVNEQAIEKIIGIYKKENIQVTKEWILHGQGDKPSYIFPQNPVENFVGIDPSSDDELAINREIEFFEKSHKNAKVIIIEDDDMAPLYKCGDYVGGIEIPKNRYDEIDDVDCIILMKKSGFVLRRVNRESKNKFRLSILNSNSKNTKPVIYNASLSFIAPAIWIRRQRKF